ncbi:MAG TPA: bifunctional phosphoribosylaminoimidazolecarboxamide formyltransferase/IMP cyclohydrolase [Actinomycetota bacterium]|nr:bifunctional phosphoribosylaminoimidazolecarboxamide formyltransferase/IMP cyclohydrolase [Actinomycetota bacterium]
MKIERALLSVSDKKGLVEFARGLVDAGVQILSSGGTASELVAAGVPVRKVADVTGAPEILGGRVKTLHPKIHGGILANRSNPDHLADLKEQGIEPIDLIVCNLYPFEKTVGRAGVSEEEAVEQIDIGGPAMVRAAAKNFHSVAVVVDPRRYDEVLEHIKRDGGIPLDVRRNLALEAFSHTAAYDAAIFRYFADEEDYPERLVLAATKVLDLRYGENPHQSAAFYRLGRIPRGLAAAAQLGGKELSYNNLLDSDAAWRLVTELEGSAAAIIKHSNPCGVAIAASISEAYKKALECDRTSAFGGIVALNRPCDQPTAEAIAEIFTEVVMAPEYSKEALEVLRSKKNLRILVLSEPPPVDSDLRAVSGGLLVQSADPRDGAEDAKVVTRAEPTSQQWADLRFAWVVAKHVKSNAIVLAKDQTAVGVGAGQMSRVESTELAARRAGDRAQGTVCASDAFFPFRDGLDAAVAAGARAVIQPGGSVRDDEVIAAADEHGIPMVFTGRRHFRH